MSDPKQVNALDDLISAWWLEQDEPTIVHDGVEYLASTRLAEALIAAGWVSPEEHRAVTMERNQARADRKAAWAGLATTESKLAAATTNGNWQAGNGQKYMGLYGRLYNRIDALIEECLRGHDPVQQSLAWEFRALLAEPTEPQ